MRGDTVPHVQDPSETRFRDRRDAGRRLAARLDALRGEDVAVLGLARGGVPVAAEVARAIGAPLDVLVVRKLGAPNQPELAVGAIAPGGVRVVNERIARALGIDAETIDVIARREAAEIRRREDAYREGRPPPRVRGKTVVLVDDGIATGATARAAVRWAREQGAARVVLAAPVIARQTADELARVADVLVAALAPEDLQAVGLWYQDFSQTSDDEVREALRGGATRAAASRRGAEPLEPAAEREVRLRVPEGAVAGTLAVPRGATGLVVFAHGSGSGRHSPRNRAVAQRFRADGLGTLLFDLLTPEEDEIDRRTSELRFDIPLLSRRLADIVDVLGREETTRDLAIGIFGASTGAAAALRAAAERPEAVGAVVSRGGRPDLAGAEALRRVRAPTLLVVGGDDVQVLDMNRAAYELIPAEKRLAVVPGAGHLFEEPGTLERMADLAAAWFRERLRR